MIKWIRRLFKLEPMPCPYCKNPDRDSIFFQQGGRCLYDNSDEVRHGIIGADPPCLCDGYPSPSQLRSIGCSKDNRR